MTLTVRFGTLTRVIDTTEHRDAFVALASELPEPYELSGVTYHGPDAHPEWVAFLSSPTDPGGCEGWGDTPIDALRDLRRHMRKEHPDEFSGINEG